MKGFKEVQGRHKEIGWGWSGLGGLWIVAGELLVTKQRRWLLCLGLAGVGPDHEMVWAEPSGGRSWMGRIDTVKSLISSIFLSSSISSVI